MLAEGGGRGSPLESVECRVLHAVLREKSFPTRPMRVGLSAGTSKCPGMLKHPSANGWNTCLLSLRAQTWWYSLKGIASFEDPFPYLRVGSLIFLRTVQSDFFIS